MNDIKEFIVRLPFKQIQDGDTTIYLKNNKKLVHELKELGIDVPQTVEIFLINLRKSLQPSITDGIRTIEQPKQNQHPCWNTAKEEYHETHNLINTNY